MTWGGPLSNQLQLNWIKQHVSWCSLHPFPRTSTDLGHGDDLPLPKKYLQKEVFSRRLIGRLNRVWDSTQSCCWRSTSWHSIVDLQCRLYKKYLITEQLKNTYTFLSLGIFTDTFEMTCWYWSCSCDSTIFRVRWTKCWKLFPCLRYLSAWWTQTLWVG